LWLIKTRFRRLKGGGKYLDEFLMDKRVIDVPYLLRALIVKWFILPSRPKKSAEAYQSIWWEEGSPLIVLTRRLLDKVRKSIKDIPVAMGMRYGSPSIKSGISNLIAEEKDLEEIFLIPLYPHYAMSSYESVVVKAEKVVKNYFPSIKLKVFPPFFDNENYNEVLFNSIKENLPEEYDLILFSYHGLPERHLRKTDPTGKHCLATEECCQKDSHAHLTCYKHQVLETTGRMAESLQLDSNEYTTSFQSRLGNDKWILPSTDTTLENLPEKGIKKLVVVCPAFVSDCLETIEEMGDRGKRNFLEAGGEEFTLIPCLNDQTAWADLVTSWVNDFKTENLGV